MKQLDKIEFLFENCETKVVEGKYIGNITIDGIHKKIERVASNAITDITIADNIAIEIHNKGADGLNRFDITRLYLYWKGEEQSECILVDWRDWVGNDTTNSYQINYISNLKNLYIVIDKNKVLTDYFNIDEIDSKEYMKYYGCFACEDEEEEKLEKLKSDIKESKEKINNIKSEENDEVKNNDDKVKLLTNNISQYFSEQLLCVENHLNVGKINCNRYNCDCEECWKQHLINLYKTMK